MNLYQQLGQVHWGIMIPLAIWMLGIPKFTDDFINTLVKAKADGTMADYKLFSFLLSLVWPILIAASAYDMIRKRMPR